MAYIRKRTILDTLSQRRLIHGAGYKLSESATDSLNALQRRGFVRRGKGILRSSQRRAAATRIGKGERGLPRNREATGRG